MKEHTDHLASGVLLVGFDGGSLPRAVARGLRDGRYGGVVLFSRNFESVAHLQSLIDAVVSATPSGEPWIAIDQEGGRVQRLRDPFPELPPMRDFGSVGRKSVVRRAGALLGRALAALGIRQNYAPVLDVDTNRDNPIIGDRSFGPEPALVARLGAAFIDGHQQAGTAACAKHFPGHGDTEEDSHLALPVVHTPSSTLQTRELLPFRSAVQVDVAAVMTAHVVYRAWDPDCPATLSRAIIEPWLRQELGYGGVVVSDDLEMAGVGGAPHEVAVSALSAGCDQLLVCANPEAADEAWDAIVSALDGGDLDPERLQAARARRHRLEASYPFRRGSVDFDDLRRERDAVVAMLESGHDPGPRARPEEAAYDFEGDPDLALEVDDESMG